MKKCVWQGYVSGNTSTIIGQLKWLCHAYLQKLIEVLINRNSRTCRPKWEEIV